MTVEKVYGLFVVWKKYQRRPEVLAPKIHCKVRFLPHWFKSKFLRPFDYLFKLIINIRDIWQNKPNFIVAQSPPIFSVIPASITGIPYIIDAHNPLFQVKMWKKLPLSRYFIQKSGAVIVHNSEILQLAEKMYPSVKLFNIADPIEFISASSNRQRKEKQILIISSFDPWDEPVELIVECIKELPEFTFIITADINKLSTELNLELQQINNVVLTGFLPIKEYHDVLCSSLAALVLTTSDATQPSGACEALSSDTQLIISQTSLTQELFGEWAILVDNSKESITQAIKSLTNQKIDLTYHRNQWNMSVEQELAKLEQAIQDLLKSPTTFK